MIINVELFFLCCRINLYDLAPILLEYGFVNAINFDGGGSATYVINGTLVNYPSDTW